MSKEILIIGGMGPQASLELHERILDVSAEHGAKHGHDFPEITHLSLPVEDFINDSKGKDKALRLITRALHRVYLWRQYSDSYSLQYSAYLARPA